MVDEPRRRAVVLCRHYREGENYCAEHKLNPITTLIVVTDSDLWETQLRGRLTRPGDVHRVDGWIFGRNARAIDEELAVQAQHPTMHEVDQDHNDG